MDIKKKLLGSAATIALASMATIGGTFAYFSDSTSAQSQFTNGTIVLKPHEPYLESFNIKGFKPGDVLVANRDNEEPAMILNNQGTLPFEVFMKVSLDGTEVNENDSTANHIIVKSLKFGGEDLLENFSTNPTLAEVATYFNNGNTTLNNNNIENVGKYIGFLDPGKDLDGNNKSEPWTKGAIKALTYELEFKDTGEDQNHLQGLETKIGFEFTALQFDGTTYNHENLDNGSDQGGGTYENKDEIKGSERP